MVLRRGRRDQVVQALAIDAHDAAVDVGAGARGWIGWPSSATATVPVPALRRAEHEVGVLADDRARGSRRPRRRSRRPRSSCQVPASAKWLVASLDGVA